MELAICDTGFSMELYGLLDSDGLTQAIKSVYKHIKYYYSKHMNSVPPEARISKWQNIDGDDGDMFYIEIYDTSTNKWKGWYGIHFERNLMPNIPYEQHFDLDEFMELMELMEENI